MAVASFTRAVTTLTSALSAKRNVAVDATMRRLSTLLADAISTRSEFVNGVSLNRAATGTLLQNTAATAMLLRQKREASPLAWAQQQISAVVLPAGPAEYTILSGMLAHANQRLDQAGQRFEGTMLTDISFDDGESDGDGESSGAFDKCIPACDAFDWFEAEVLIIVTPIVQALIAAL